MSDTRLIITADEAISLLQDGPYIHNFAGGGAILLGVDYDRDDAIKAFRDAARIEIGGDNCKALKHPIVVLDHKGRITFFAADMDKVAAMEAAKV